MKYIIEVEATSFEHPQALAELKHEGNVWKLRIDAERCSTRRELNEVIDTQLRFAGIQLAAAMTRAYVWPPT